MQARDSGRLTERGDSWRGAVEGSRARDPHNPVLHHPFLYAWYFLLGLVVAFGAEGTLSRTVDDVADGDTSIAFTLAFLRLPVAVGLAGLIALLRSTGAWRRPLAVVRLVLWSGALALAMTGVEAIYGRSTSREDAEQAVLAIVGDPAVADAVVDGVTGGFVALMLAVVGMTAAFFVLALRDGEPLRIRTEEERRPLRRGEKLVAAATPVVVVVLTYVVWPGTG